MKSFALSICPLCLLVVGSLRAAEPIQERSPAKPDEKLVPLKYDSPVMGFDVFWPDRVPPRATLEPYSNKPPPPLMVPIGCANLALNKKVTSSNPKPLIGEHAMITDGEKDGHNTNVVELECGKQWVQIDLEKPADISAIVIWHFVNDTRVYHGVVVQISDDPKFAKGVTTVFNNDFANTHGLGAGKQLEYIEDNRGKAIAAKDEKGQPIRGQYVRLYSNGYAGKFRAESDLNHYLEVEVYGRPRASAH